MPQLGGGSSAGKNPSSPSWRRRSAICARSAVSTTDRHHVRSHRRCDGRAVGLDLVSSGSIARNRFRRHELLRARRAAAGPRVESLSSRLHPVRAHDHVGRVAARTRGTRRRLLRAPPRARSHGTPGRSSDPCVVSVGPAVDLDRRPGVDLVHDSAAIRRSISSCVLNTETASRIRCSLPMIVAVMRASRSFF